MIACQNNRRREIMSNKVFKRLVTLVLAVVVVISTFGVTELTPAAANNSTMQISGHTTIPSVDIGQYKTVSGTITSSYDFTYINGYILKSDHKTIVYKGSATAAELKKNKRKYSLANSNVDRKLYFNKLSAGTYYLKITSKNTNEEAVALVDYKFTVQAKSTLKISNATKPTSITQGSYFDLKGSISSNYKLTSVAGKIVTSDGNTVKYSKEVVPTGKTFSLYGSAVDRSLLFNKLSTGTYYYKLTAKDASGKSLELINQKFTVTAKKSSSTKASNTILKLGTETYTYSGKKYTIIKGSTKYTGNRYNQKNAEYKKVFGEVGCSATAIATEIAIMTGVDRTPTNYWKNGGGTLSYYGKVASVTSGQKATLKKCYELVTSGTPGVVHFTSGTHFVTVIGVVQGADKNNLKTSDFLVIDPYQGAIRRMDSAASINRVSNASEVRWYTKIY
jgi:hypothetical protein